MARSLKVVFKSDVRGIASAGDVKIVSPGYARNYLFPRHLAFPAIDSAMRQWDTERQGTLAKVERRRTDLQSQSERISAVTLTLSAKAGPEGHLFGSITRQEIVDALTKEGITVEKRAILLRDPIKQVGPGTVTVHLGAGVEATLKLTVTAAS